MKDPTMVSEIKPGDTFYVGEIKNNRIIANEYTCTQIVITCFNVDGTVSGYLKCERREYTFDFAYCYKTPELAKSYFYSQLGKHSGIKEGEE